MTETESNFRRTKAQMIISFGDMDLVGGFPKGDKNGEEVDSVKQQLNKLQMCKMELQAQVKRGRDLLKGFEKTCSSQGYYTLDDIGYGCN
ncbi:hypothetical protein SAY87_015424 [Trapa incisa]|uniref:Uncharacterized protein n=1 Tax=Trapa incisa TaxID=236973 RepID=A0AAN7JM84_9MYRT|nr:hypothetical protein SAY87_015424 [Trapa incisa]